ncbi:MAG TPA: hypothetical protein VIY69_09030, partial [Candidatus Acidoferrales bacterium]
MRRLFPVLLLIVIATTAHAQSGIPDVPLETGADACRYALIYNSAKYLDSDFAIGVHFNIGQCEDWATKQRNWEAAHNSFVALDSFYNLQSAALEAQLKALRPILLPYDNAPSVCKVFMDDQAAAENATRAARAAKLSDLEVSASSSRAEQDFRAGFSNSFERSEQVAKDLLTCSDWA